MDLDRDEIKEIKEIAEEFGLREEAVKKTYRTVKASILKEARIKEFIDILVRNKVRALFSNH